MTKLVGSLISSNITAIPMMIGRIFTVIAMSIISYRPNMRCLLQLRHAGYLPTYDIGWGGPDFHSKEYDLKAYVEEIFKLSEVEFRETYAEYPIIIDKMEEMVKVLHKHGVKV